MTMVSIEPEGISQDGGYHLNYDYLNMLQNSYPYYQYDYSLPAPSYPPQFVVNFVDGQYLLYQPVDNNVNCPPFSFVPQEQQELNPMKLQEFQFFVVIDFEATCDKDKIPYPQEIIEFPSVIVDAASGRIVDCFRKFVRPTCNQKLTEFCKNLTGISQAQIDQKGVSLVQALQEHDEWLASWGVKNAKFSVVTWTSWDCRVLLESECKYKGIQKPPYFDQWINLKVLFRQTCGNPYDLKQAVGMVGLQWQGRPHSGIDDAKNTALLLVYLMSKGIKLTITDTLIQASAEQPIIKKLQTQSRSFSPYYHQQMSVHVSPADDTRHVRHGGAKSNTGAKSISSVKSVKVTIRKPSSNLGNSSYNSGN